MLLISSCSWKFTGADYITSTLSLATWFQKLTGWLLLWLCTCNFNGWSHHTYLALCPHGSAMLILLFCLQPSLGLVLAEKSDVDAKTLFVILSWSGSPADLDLCMRSPDGTVSSLTKTDSKATAIKSVKWGTSVSLLRAYACTPFENGLCMLQDHSILDSFVEDALHRLFVVCVQMHRRRHAHIQRMN